MKNFHVSAPGRICLFGDHQDYLELPVIACAIDRRLNIVAKENNRKEFHIQMPDIGMERIIPIDSDFQKLTPHDHLGSAMKVVRRYGCTLDRGFDLQIESQIPINAGVSSSSAVVVAWIHFLLKAFGIQKKISPEFIGQLAYEAEVLEHNSPGGKMDQYTIAVGGIVHIETGKPFQCKLLGNQMAGLVLGESGIPKQTIGILGEARNNAQKGIAQILQTRPKFQLQKANLEDLSMYLNSVDKELQPYVFAAIKNHSITQKALPLFNNTSANLSAIGDLMNEHHKVLRDDVKVSVPKIDLMIEAALSAGAYGAKIVGSGGGGSMVAIAPSEKQVAIMEAIKACGVSNVNPVTVAMGTKLVQS